MAASHKIPSERDLELLSAYLDNELTGREREVLENRLARDNTLRAVLDDLHDTVALVRDLPRLPAPHNFTLDPAVYGRKKSWWQQLQQVFNLGIVLQVSGALGTAAAVVLISLAVMQGRSDDGGTPEPRAVNQTSVGYVSQTGTPAEVGAQSSAEEAGSVFGEEGEAGVLDWDAADTTVLPEPSAELAPVGGAENAAESGEDIRTEALQDGAVNTESPAEGQTSVSEPTATLFSLLTTEESAVLIGPSPEANIPSVPQDVALADDATGTLATPVPLPCPTPPPATITATVIQAQTPAAFEATITADAFGLTAPVAMPTQAVSPTSEPMTGAYPVETEGESPPPSYTEAAGEPDGFKETPDESDVVTTGMDETEEAAEVEIAEAVAAMPQMDAEGVVPAEEMAETLPDAAPSQVTATFADEPPAAFAPGLMASATGTPTVLPTLTWLSSSTATMTPTLSVTATTTMTPTGTPTATALPATSVPSPTSPPTNTVMPTHTLTPAEIAQAQSPVVRDVTPATAEKRRPEDEDEDRNAWWLAGLGLITLAGSVTVFMIGRRKAFRR